MKSFLFLISAICCSSLFAKPLQMEVSAKSAILMNAETGAILYEKNAHAPAYPASITKVATAHFVLDGKKADITKSVTVSADCIRVKPPKKNWSSLPPYWLEVDGTKMGLVKGEELPIETLLHGMLLISANDAANVLAEAMSGSVSAFVEELNQYLLSIGCLHTHFCNPHGLHHPEHVTTAYDMGIITKHAIRNPKFREIVSKLTYKKPHTNRQPEETFRQFNHLIRPGRFFYPKAIGVKTGYTSQAKNTLVAAAQQDGRTLIAVVLGCEKRNDRYQDVTKLFETAFAEKKVHRTLFANQSSFTHTVDGGTKPLLAILDHEVGIDFFPAEESEPKAQIHWTLPEFPIRQGQTVAELRLQDANGNLLATAPLIAKEDVNASWSWTIKHLWSGLFH